VLQPLRRAGPKGEGRFEPVSWATALAEIGARLRGIVAAHGGEAVLPFSYAGNMGLTQYAGMDRRFFARLGASRLLRTICGDTANAGVALTNGTPTGIRPEDVRHARYLVLWGTNTVVTNLHLWPFVLEARRAGARIVVIDPLRTRTAAAADWHLRPLPGTDAALALGLAHVILAEGRHDADYVAHHTEGLEAFRARAAGFPPERAAALTGLDPGDIVRLAREYAGTRPALIRTLVGPEKHRQGGMAFRAIACLPALVGAWRDRGGGLLHWTRMLHAEALDTRAVGRPDLAPGPTRSLNMIQLGRILTDPALAPPVKALIVYDANPAVTLPALVRVRAGLAREDLLTVVHDMFVTDTARYADYLLPAASFVEQWNLLYPWGHTWVILNRPAIAPRGESVTNGELFRRLAAAMGFTEPAFQDGDEALVQAALGGGHPLLAGISWERLLAEGWADLALPEDWRPFARGGFPTPSGRCRLADPALPARGLPAAPDFTPAPPGGRPLALVTAKGPPSFLNSSYAHLPRHRREAGPPRLDIHPDDAAPRAIADGDRVRVISDHGAVELTARVGDRVRPGVVALPHGYWPSREAGVAGNLLTGDELADLGGGGAFYGTRVDVEARPAGGSTQPRDTGPARQ
jgi:anaerobic selenocysteine-containing dehydrogenase